MRVPAEAKLAALQLAPRVDVDYGAFRWLELSEADFARLSASGVPYFEDLNAGDVQVMAYRFDPLVEGEPEIARGMQADKGASGFRLVQLNGPARDAWLQQVEATGVDVLQYYPFNTFLVWAPSQQALVVEGLDFVRWQGAFHPAYKINSDLEGRSGQIENVDVMFYNDTYILPWSLALLAGLHIFLLERAGAGGIWVAAVRVPDRSEPLFPSLLFKDLVFMLLVFLALATLAVLFPAPLEPQADPTDSSYNPRPEWYFYFVFQMLKIFEGKLELVGTVILPNLGIAALLLVPFLDRSPERSPARRKLMMAAGAAAVASIIALTIAGARAPIVNAPSVTSPSVLAGRELYAKSGCSACHSIHGKGGMIGPDLTHVAARRPDTDWHVRHFRDPKAMVPGSLMPKIDLTDKELRELADYMLSLK